MLTKQEIVIMLVVVASHMAIMALTGDWVTVKSFITLQINGANCDIRDNESYNVFGSICGVPMYELEPVLAPIIYTLMTINYAVALVLVYLVVIKRIQKGMVKSLLLTMAVLSVLSPLLWMFVEKKTLPNDQKYFLLFGFGTIASFICSVVSAFLMFFV